ncbi:pyridoxamine 5'-phosphate oxidase family protein [Mesonia aestuariivivens]|uniref:Pyridoxamine 5'-phosphate oxidase family protein n=1 Tax=Mesonia aestuariivivens TaxID=2796128 RepID=A0ABS6W3M6_9FLAO|nr:pyridoxamine 5'-phosphate oxidase family protein [Mesonia aestuariivivens]MBW2962147.1 pyridoxamine 5'-phosphate oxidase family protein [Mesonia aestuariivivens]
MSTENKYNEEAKKKIKELTEDIKTSMMVTALGKTPLQAVPMTQKKIDIHGDIWFLSPGDSDHNKNIIKNKETQLLYSDPSSHKFLSTFGEAEIVVEQAILEELYSSVSDNWFNGKDDPNLTAIKFTPKEAYYWDTKTNKLVSLFKMGVGAVTGKKADVGEKGKLSV